MHTFLKANSTPAAQFQPTTGHRHAVSKEMREYMAQKSFEPQLEMKKQGSLDRFFKEKYAIISDLLGNPIRAGGLNVVQTARHDVDSSKSRNAYFSPQTPQKCPFAGGKRVKFT